MSKEAEILMEKFKNLPDKDKFTVNDYIKLNEDGKLDSIMLSMVFYSFGYLTALSNKDDKKGEENEFNN